MAVPWQVLDTEIFHCPVGFKDAGILCLCRGWNNNHTSSSHQNKTTLGSSGKRQDRNCVSWQKRKHCNRLPGMLNILEAFLIWQVVLGFETIICKNNPRIKDLNFNEMFIVFEKLIQEPLVLSYSNSHWKTLQKGISPLFMFS